MDKFWWDVSTGFSWLPVKQALLCFIIEKLMLYKCLQFDVILLSQEDAADEIAEKIARFVSSLPKSIRKIEEEPLPEHIQKMFDEATDTHHHHHHAHHHSHDHHHHDHGSHDHAHGAGFMDPYGVGHGWGR